MPRFSDKEKEIIQNSLIVEGEKLFSQFGIRKVTVDDLVNATGIAKGSFYAFYSSKEHLYMDILSRRQEELWVKVDVFLEENKNIPPKKLVKKVFVWAIEQMKATPILMQFTGETSDYLFRKLPKEIMDAHTHDDSQALEKLTTYGVTFTCSIEVATKAVQLYAMTHFQYCATGDTEMQAALELLLNGVVNEIVDGGV